MPNALAVKYPNADASWSWQWVFPAAHRSIDPRAESSAGTTSESKSSSERFATRFAVTTRRITTRCPQPE